VGHNCKLHIKNAKLKGATLVKTDSFNMELSIENSTIETTDTMIHAGANLKVKMQGSTLTSAVAVIDSDSNMELDVDDTTAESKGGAAVKAKYNLKVRMENGKIRGKKAAIDADSNLTLSMKKNSELTSSDGLGVKTSSGFNLDSDGGKIDAPGGAIVVSSGASLTATNLVLSSKERTIGATSSLKMEWEGGSITSSGDAAIDGDSSLALELDNVKVQGATVGINCSSNANIKATKKTRIIGISGNGITTTSNTQLNLSDASVEGGAKAFKGSVNTKIKLAQGARLAGKKGGVEVEGNLDLDATGATIEGGTGAGLLGGYNAKIQFKQGLLKGVPAIQVDRRPSIFDLSGTRVEGEQRVPK
jgi:hypothetical protein